MRIQKNALTFLATIFFAIGGDVARADLLFGMFGSTPVTQNAVYRYREDGTYLGIVGSAGETDQGIALGPDGNLYTVSNNVGSGTIARYNPATGAFLGKLVAEGANFFSPNGITFSVSGNCYSTGYDGNSRLGGVVKFDGISGASLGTVIADGANNLTTITNVLTTPNGDLLVSDGSRINRYDGTSFDFENAFVGQGAGGIGSINQYTFGPDGNLYIASQTSVYEFDGENGAFLKTFASGIFGPQGLTFGNDGDLYVVSFSSPTVTVQRFDGLTGQSLGTFLPPNYLYQMGYYLITAPDLPEPASISLFALAIVVFARRSR